MTLAQLVLIKTESGAIRLLDEAKQDAAVVIIKNHYAHSVPSGKSHYFAFESAIVVYSIPANPFISKFILGKDGEVWELSRLWAPDGHPNNLLSQAISASLKELRKIEPKIDAVISYADPNVGHSGYVYKAASWMYLGQSDESRYYQDENGQVVARRKFHSGAKKYAVKSDIEAMGYHELRLPGKHRFVKGLTPTARKNICKRFGLQLGM